MTDDPTHSPPIAAGFTLADEPAPDLRALATPVDAGALERLASRIDAAAAPELARRAAVARPAFAVVRGGGAAPRVGALRVRTRLDARTGGLTAAIAAALRPALVAAAAAAALAVGLARQADGTATAGQQVADAGAVLGNVSSVQALSLHDSTAQWADQARAPSADALGRAIGLGGAP